AMEIIGLSAKEQKDIFHVVSGVLHLGNIQFSESGNYACITNTKDLQYVSSLLSIGSDLLGTKLVSRVMDGKWGRQTDRIEVTLGLEQALYTRNALAKALYARLFDFLVK
ncbi:unnamed protein product, partial [Allacma fusca]